MKIPGLDGDWELYTGESLDTAVGDFRILKRISEKSELEKWIEDSKWEFQVTDHQLTKEGYADRRRAYEDGIRNGFYRAICALRQSDHMCAPNVIPILKAYCGDK